MKVHNYIRYIVSNKPNIRFRYLVVYHPFAGSGTGCSKMAGYLVHCTGYPVCPYQVDSNMLFVVLTVKCSSLVSSTYFSGNTIDRESRDKKAKKTAKCQVSGSYSFIQKSSQFMREPKPLLK